jgi:peptidoglycan/LPS O-acetylase OafA/YrhL
MIFFVTNFFGTLNEMWSVSMEMQFYMVSPCIVLFMYKHKAPMTVAFVMTMLNLVATAGILYKACPTAISKPSDLEWPYGKCDVPYGQ